MLYILLLLELKKLKEELKIDRRENGKTNSKN